MRDITTNPDDAAIAGAVVAMAHSLKLKVIAEGVETLEQLDFLRSLKCDAVQGYFISSSPANSTAYSPTSAKTCAGLTSWRAGRANARVNNVRAPDLRQINSAKRNRLERELSTVSFLQKPEFNRENAKRLSWKFVSRNYKTTSAFRHYSVIS